LVEAHRELGISLALQQIQREKLLLMIIFFLSLSQGNPTTTPKLKKAWFELPLDNGNAEESIVLMRFV